MTSWPSVSLLFLLPPSCMVVPIGNSANKLSFLFSTFSTITTASNIKTSLPTMSTQIDIGMDIQSEQTLTNNSEVRGRNLLSLVNSFRDFSMAFSGQSTPYHERMVTDTDCVPISRELNKECPQLSYKTVQENALRVGMAANQQETLRPQDVNNEAFPIHAQHENDVINIQILYDPNAPTEPEL